MIRPQRAYYNDWIRIIVVLLLVPFHSAVTFTEHGDTFIKYKQNAPFLDIFTWFLAIWMMPVLFVVSGMSTYFSLQGRTSGQYIKERFTKLLIPLAAGTVLICSVMSYLRALFIGSFSGSFFQFYPYFFSEGPYPRGNLNWGQLWFLAYLFVFSALLLPVFSFMNRNDVKTGIIKATSVLEKGPRIFMLALPLMVTETIFRPIFPGLQNLIADWANFTLYMMLMFYGFIFAINNRILDNIERLRVFSLSLGAFLFMTALSLRTAGIARSIGFLYPAYNALMVFTWVLAVIGFAKKYANFKNGLYNYLNAASFPFYIFHFLPLTILAYLAVRSDFNIWIKYAAFILFTYPATFALYETIKRIPFIRFLFGIKLKVK
jgi:glucans biosynthesis protein C